METVEVDIHGKIVPAAASCESILKQNDMYNDVKRVFSTKSSRK